ncbi:helix-turn-helix transcriptional regulator [Actinomadura sp. WMMA1423]|uniref:ArsR/SmtB family transcription factor n=1 Tax=Actinomadura sp. WMMA1423 TaxID=2591108 RepID=UPI0011473A87|nr:metalloregulator ArsR/SmtB family transcription factor [Actinomadura sp. WMMA1423]
MGEYQADLLDSVFSAVSDPTRRAILARLAESDARVTDVAGAFPISLNSTSKHIRVLEGAGLVRRNVRGREHILTLEAAPLAEAAAWIEHYRGFWSEQLAALEAFVTDRAAAEGPAAERPAGDRSAADRDEAEGGS